MKRTIQFSVLIALLVFFLCGCNARTVEDMYSLPKRSPEFNNLQAVMDSAMLGMEFLAPVSGDNRQSVQTADLDGDGHDEYVIFAKGNRETPLSILVLRQQEDEKFEVMESIACKGSAFEQVQYEDMDGKPGKEIVVGRRINDQVNRIASVYSFASGQSEQIMSSIYMKYVTCDLNGDGQKELLVIRNGDTGNENGVAVMYGYRKDALVRSVEAVLSEKADHIKRMTLHSLSDGRPAVYIASATGDNSVITDILTLKEDVLTNISLSTETGAGVQTLRNYYVYAEDIDFDGILELPSLITMRYSAAVSEDVEQDLIRWYSVDTDGIQTDKLYTFHCFTGGWYLKLEKAWVDRLAVEENGNNYTFYMWNENYGEAMPIFSVCILTGKDRDSQASAQNRFPLYRGENVTFAGKLESASAIYGFTESYLTSSFHLIHQDWKNAET